MSTVKSLILPAALLTALAACGGAEPKPVVATTRTTSAAFTARPQDEAEKRALKQRNEEQAALLDEERETRQMLFDRQKEVASTKRERDELAIKVAESIENADLVLDAVREDAVKNGWRKWWQIDKAQRKAQRHKAKLLMDMRRLHGDLGMMTWPSFKEDVERSIGELEATTAEARAIH